MTRDRRRRGLDHNRWGLSTLATRIDAEARFTDVRMYVRVDGRDGRTDGRMDGSPTSHHPQLASDWFHHSRIMCCCGIPRWGLSLLPPESPGQPPLRSTTFNRDALHRSLARDGGQDRGRRTLRFLRDFLFHSKENSVLLSWFFSHSFSLSLLKILVFYLDRKRDFCLINEKSSNFSYLSI